MGCDSARSTVGPTVEREDEVARYYLGFLRDGTRDEKIAARKSLARIFERRGMLDEAVELYERNVLAGARDGILYQRLAAAYQRQGRIELARATLRRGRQLCPSRAGEGTSVDRPDSRVARRPAAAARRQARPRTRLRQPAASLIAALCFASLLVLLDGPTGGFGQAPIPDPDRTEEMSDLLVVNPSRLGVLAGDDAVAVLAIEEALLDAPSSRIDALAALVDEADVLVDVPEPANSDPDPIRSDPLPESGAFVVVDVGWAGLSLRRSPGTGEPMRVWPEGAEVRGLGEWVEATGRTWLKVRDPDGNEGWAAADFLVAQSIEFPTIRMAGAASAANLAEPRSLTPNQLTDGATLTISEAIAACAPAAAVAFARVHGFDPTLDEAVALARRVGWTPWEGMAGPRSQVDLLAWMGIAARLEHPNGGIDWTRVVDDVQAGKPVIVAAADHYFVAEGYDPESGRFDFGNSAAVLRAAGGKRWFAPRELASLRMGPPVSTIHLVASAPPLALANLAASDGAAR